MTSSQKTKCHQIIHTSATAAAGVAAGTAQLPCADQFPIAAIEVNMVREIGKVFGQKVTETVAKGIISAVAGATVGRTISQVLVGWMPGIGNTINAATAASVVEAIGWGAASHFDE